MTFDDAFAALIGHEGGYANHPNDPGGETKYGISKRSYPGEDIRNLTLTRAKEIYRRDFWGPAGCDVLPDEIRFDVFDMAVNSGVRQSVKTLQKAVYADVDGILGPRTLMAANNMQPHQVVARFNGVRLAFMASLGNWPTFSKGWALRIADNLLGEYR
jgi:lysozyme family protein